MLTSSIVLLEANVHSVEGSAIIVDATIISRCPSIVAVEIDGEIVMMNIQEARYFGLDQVGSDIWRHIEPPCSFGELINRLAADYDADVETITADVQAFLHRMVAQDAIRLS